MSIDCVRSPDFSLSRVLRSLFLFAALPSVVLSLLHSPLSAQAKVTANGFTLGVIVPLTGPAASMGQSIEKALRLVDRKELAFDFQDDQCDAKKALAAYHLLHARGIRIFYVACSGSMLALAPLAKQDSALLVSTYAGSMELAKTGTEVMRFNPDALSILGPMEKYFDAAPEKRFALFAEEQDYAISLAQGIAKSLGSRLVANETYRVQDSSYKSQIMRMRSKVFDELIIIPVSDKAAQILYRELSELGFNRPLLGEVNLCDYAVNPKQFGLHGQCWDARVSGPGYEAFLKTFQERYQGVPQYPFYDALTFDAGHILADIFSELGTSYSAPAVAARLLQGRKGRVSEYRFAPNGDAFAGNYLNLEKF
jgi:ABC-type branched-subunit amino acid transport system substrate-binding protein